MRKFISAFALMAIITTLFLGSVPVFAAARDTEIILNQDFVYRSTGFMQVSGRVVDKLTQATAYGYNANVTIAGVPFPADNGNFTATFTSGIGIIPITAAPQAPDWNGSVSSVRVIPRITLDSGSTMQITYPAPGWVTIQGLFPDGNGGSVTNLQLGYVKADNTMDGAPLATAPIKEPSYFGFSVNGAVFNKLGKIGIFTDGALAYEGQVSSQPFTASMSPTQLPRNLGPQRVTFTTDISSQYLDGDKMKAGYSLTVTFLNSDGTHKFGPVTLADNVKPFASGQKSSTDLDCSVWDTGIYKAKLEIRSGPLVIGENTLDFSVTMPADYTLMGWGMDTASVGDITIIFPDSNTGAWPPGDFQRIEVRNSAGILMKHYKVDITGSGLDKTFTNYGPDKVPGNIAVFSPNLTGNMQVVVKVYANATDVNPVATFNRTVKVTGFNVDVNPQQVQADFKGDLVVTITDENNNPINNAILDFQKSSGGGYVTVLNGSIDNIQNGQYVYRNDKNSFFTSVGTIDVRVRGFHGGKFLTIEFKDAIAVVGEQVYTVTSNKESLVNGFEDTFYVTTKQGSQVIFPERVERIDVDKDGKYLPPQVISGVGYKDLDGDGVKEAFGIKLTPTNSQKYLIIRTSTNAGKKMGEVKLNVVGAEAEMTGAQAATENIRSKFTFSAKDPRDGKPITSPIYFSSSREYVDYRVRDRNNIEVGMTPAGVSATISQYNSVYEFYIYVDDVDWDKAVANKQEELVISVFAKTTGLEDIKLFDIPIGEAVLVADPPEIVYGSQPRNIEITYLAADEKPLANYKVSANDEEIGETDENGKVWYIGAASGLQINLKAVTDDKNNADTLVKNPSANNKDTIYTEAKIKSVVDTKPPTASAPATVNESSVLVTIEDNGLINNVRINNVPMDIFFPQSKLTHIHTGLKKGVNTITVEAVDIAGNYGKTVLQVNYTETPGTPPPPGGGGVVEFVINKQTEYGMPQLVDGTTMVPARFVEILGVSFEFDNATKTATYKYGDNTISVTNNKATALVNGEPVLMTKPAYINEQGRFMVPLRMIGQELGFKVHWDNATKSGTITK